MKKLQGDRENSRIVCIIYSRFCCECVVVGFDFCVLHHKQQVVHVQLCCGSHAEGGGYLCCDNLSGLEVLVTMVECKKEKRKVRWLGGDLCFRVKLQLV